MNTLNIISCLDSQLTGNMGSHSQSESDICPRLGQISLSAGGSGFMFAVKNQARGK